MLKRDSGGFTLIEVMVVIAIVSILVGVAFPAYQEHIRRSRRSDCSTIIVSLANALERRYSTTAPASYLAVPALPAGFTATCPRNPAPGGTFYNLAVPVLTATTFTIQATPVGPQVNDRCGSLTLTQAGVKGIVGATGGVTPQQCW